MFVMRSSWPLGCCADGCFPLPPPGLALNNPWKEQRSTPPPGLAPRPFQDLHPGLVFVRVLSALVPMLLCIEFYCPVPVKSGDGAPVAPVVVNSRPQAAAEIRNPQGMGGHCCGACLRTAFCQVDTRPVNIIAMH